MFSRAFTCCRAFTRSRTAICAQPSERRTYLDVKQTFFFFRNAFKKKQINSEEVGLKKLKKRPETVNACPVLVLTTNMACAFFVAVRALCVCCVCVVRMLCARGGVENVSLLLAGQLIPKTFQVGCL